MKGVRLFHPRVVPRWLGTIDTQRKNGAMSRTGITVVPVVDEAQQEQFLRLPWDLYRDDAYWVPPRIGFQREVLFKKTHPVNQFTSCQSWLAVWQGRVVGRISAIVNRLYLQRYADGMGFFGFFECVNHPEVARQLFDAASAWLEKRGITGIQGPVQPSIHYEAGLLLTSCEPFFTSTYNPPYYARLLESCGFTRSRTMCTYAMDIGMLKNLDPRIEWTAKAAVERLDIRLRHFAVERLDGDLREYFRLYNLTMNSMWSFVPLTDSEIERAIDTYSRTLTTQLTVIAEVEDQVAGVALGVLDYHSIKRKGDESMDELEKHRPLTKPPGIRRSRMFSAHVLPQYALWGVGPAMMMFVMRAGSELGIEMVETSWIEENNDVAQQTLLRVGAVPRAEYAFFAR